VVRHQTAMEFSEQKTPIAIEYRLD